MEKDKTLEWIKPNHSNSDTEIVMKEFEIGVYAIFRSLCLEFKNNKKITKLDLNRNNIGDMYCNELVSFLEKNKSLTELNLSATSIGDKLIESLSNGLINNHTLKHLNLSENPISNKGIKDLSIALKHNRTLETLNLDYIVKLNIEGIRYLCHALEHNHTLTGIMLDYRRFGNTDDIIRIKWLIEQNTKICLEKNTIARNNLVAEKTNTAFVPSLLEIGLFAIKLSKKIHIKEKHKLLVKEITEKVEKKSFTLYI